MGPVPGELSHSYSHPAEEWAVLRGSEPPSLLQVKQKLLFIDQGLWVWDCKVGYFACDNL